MAIAGTYGRGQMLGAGVDPSLFKQDYSGFARAGETMGEAYGNIGESISKGISNFQEKKKENAKYNAQIKSAEKMIDSALQFFPENKDQLEAAKASINDPSRSTMERAMEASEVGNFINNSLNMMKMRASMDIQNQRLSQMSAGGGGSGQQNAPAPSIFDQ